MTLDKHDCFIQTADGKVLYKPSTIANNCEGFEELYSKILSCNDANVKVGIESTGHYSYNLLGFLLSKELATFVFNPFQTNQFRKSLSLRKTKTDKVDARTIALMLAIESSDNTYSLQTYQNEELKSLTRYRTDKVSQRSFPQAIFIPTRYHSFSGTRIGRFHCSFQLDLCHAP